jgi:hypothetical protein
MVTITGSWVDPATDRSFLKTLLQAGALLPSLDKAHLGLLQSQVAADQVAAALSDVQVAEAKVDVRHDRKSRGSFNVLTGFADLTDDPEKAAAYLALRDQIFPKGLEVVRWSYTDEAGEVELVDTRLSKDDKTLLGKLPTPDGTLLDAHQARLMAGRELGELERKRAELETKAPGAPTAADAVRARNLWIRTVNAFVATLELEDALSDEDRERILGPMRRAEQKAEQKADRRAPSAPEPKPAEAKAADVKPAEAKPAEVKPAEAKPAEVKAAEVKPAEVPAEPAADEKKKE